MEAAGLLTRKVDSGDARAYQLELTTLGSSILEQVENPYDRKVEHLMESFSEQELEMLINFMERMQRTIEQEN